MEAQLGISLEDLKPIKRLYNKAVKEEKTEFKYKDQTLLVSYAKYLIQYLETLK
jgi:hypothetical protein